MPEGPVCVTVTRKIEFSASHYYWLPEWSEVENNARFGLCANRHGHGHNYLAEVAVSGPLDVETGMLMNLKDLKAIMEKAIAVPLDHKLLNAEVVFFATRLPTLENIAAFIWQSLGSIMRETPGLPEGLQLHWLRLHENDRLYVTYFPDEEAFGNIAA